jgi:glyoxylase-like metal-dependent hydrolase (beta-lactamase superfamily II)
MEGAAADQLVYPFADYPAAGGAIEVADGVLWMSSPLPFVGLKQVNLWFLRDGDGWVMVDCGYGDAVSRDRLVATWANVLGGRPVTRLVITHFHPDHAGNSRFIAARWGLVPELTQGEWFAANLALADRYIDTVARRADFFRAHGLDRARIDVFREGVVPYAAGVELASDYRRIRDGDALAIGGDRWVVVTGEGHSPEHASLYCAARKILIAGDQILPAITTNISVHPTEPEGDPLALFLASGRRFRAILDPATLVLPSHRRPFLNVRRRLDELAHHHDERLNLVVAAAASDITAADLIDVLFPRALDGHQMGFAMGEAIAHLNHLVARGRMACRRDAAGIFRYRRGDGGGMIAPPAPATPGSP